MTTLHVLDVPENATVPAPASQDPAVSAGSAGGMRRRSPPCTI
ncbi:hypothetical protein HNR02_005694 [Amycolatopsis endophytica]|uniref:Uncharacterized protein n=1 Tax=Amycolatopsis endophytica TaxID=860233 RepID=A0A853BAW8_9PSEU|nr:hypothetical protein [Amycolatopsis endophytica]NYI92319.1 hypothetical protein [Amycolatopsis endophytica]